MLVKFTKMHGLGNDFMVVDGVRQKVFFSPDLIKRLGDRHFGVGFDQLLLVEAPYKPDQDFHYRIFNQDGSEVQMCGNGARCFARFVVDHGLCSKKEIKVSTIAGELTLKLEDDGEVVVNMGLPIFEANRIPFDINQVLSSSSIKPLHNDANDIRTTETDSKDRELNSLVVSNTALYTYTLALADNQAKINNVQIGTLSMGNPHMVTIVEDLDNCPIEVIGPLLEKHQAFPEKVNVGFMQVLNRDEIRLRVYERGCGETLACGSGACAAVVTGICQGLLNSKVKVRLQSGTMTISWEGVNKPVMMKGPVCQVYEGTIEL